MNQPEKNDLAQKAARGVVGGDEQQQIDKLLSNDSEFRAVYEEERALQHLLDSLPNAPLSTNFTSLVMQAVARENRQLKASGTRGIWPWLRWKWSGAAAAALACVAAGVLFYQQQKATARQSMAASLGRFTDMTAALAPQTGNAQDQVRPVRLLQDFEAINKLSYVPADSELDLELLVALQK
jgi:hypothetical protein